MRRLPVRELPVWSQPPTRRHSESWMADAKGASTKMPAMVSARFAPLSPFDPLRVIMVSLSNHGACHEQPQARYLCRGSTVSFRTRRVRNLCLTAPRASLSKGAALYPERPARALASLQALAYRGKDSSPAARNDNCPRTGGAA